MTAYYPFFLTLFRHPQYGSDTDVGALIGPTGLAWSWPGTCLSTSTVQFPAPYLDPTKLIDVRWQMQWNPLARAGKMPGVRLICYYANIVSPRELARVEHLGTGPTPRGCNASENMTTAGCATIDNGSGLTFKEAFVQEITKAKTEGHELYFGTQMHGTGSSGARLFLSELQMIWAQG